MLKFYIAFWGVVLGTMVSEVTFAQAVLSKNETIDSANSMALNNDCSNALKKIGFYIKKEEFNNLPAEQRSQAYYIAVNCALSINEIAESYDFAMQATKIPEISADIWNIRLGIEVDQKRINDALVTLETIYKQRSDVLSSVPIRTLGFLYR